MGTVEKEESVDPYWVSSTNWLVADGSLNGAIAFVTSSSTAEDTDVIPIAVLLERPAELTPCEITISFREKHEIHSIYVRSNARVYEIYYASDTNASSNEYLCTVRCSAAVPEDINAVLPRSDSNNTMEDGWVEINAPESLLQDSTLSNLSGKNICPTLQIQYEATAEISDSGPCLSVTLRLLSLQNKTSVRIEEIFIFADLIEDNDPDPPVCNVGAGSLLSMLVPGLLQLSKSGRRAQLNDGSVSGPTTRSKFSSSSDRTIDVSSLEMSETLEVAASSMMESSEMGLDAYHVSKLKTDETIGGRGCVENVLEEPLVNHSQTKPAEIEKGSDQSQNAKINGTNVDYVHLEKVLDDLVSRVGRIENFFLSAQESILKPLTGIDLRLQRMEEKLDVFFRTAAPLSSEIDPSSRISCPSEHNSNLAYGGCVPVSAVTASSSHEKAASVDELTVSLPENLKSPGLVFNAPEFFDDDNDCDRTGGDSVDGDGGGTGDYDDHDGGGDFGDHVGVFGDDGGGGGGDEDVHYESTSNRNFVELTPEECVKNGTPLSIDSALASALAAFVTSTTDGSYVHNPYPMDVHNEQQINDKDFVDSDYVAVRSVVEWVLEDRNHEVPYEAQDKTSPSDNFYSNVHDSDDTLKKIDTFDTTEAIMPLDCLSHDSILPGDDFSPEIHAQGTKSLKIRHLELFEDDIPNCNTILDSHSSDYADTHSHGRTSPSKSILNSHDDDPLKPCFDDILFWSELHPECSIISCDMDSFIGAVPVIDTLDLISQMDSDCELKKVSSVIPGQDDLISNIKFNADETLRSWLPLEDLLGEKSDDKFLNYEDLVGKSDDQIEGGNYACDTGVDQRLIPLKAQASIQRSETVDNSLLDFTCNVDQYEISAMLNAGTPISPVFFSNRPPFSTLI